VFKSEFVGDVVGKWLTLREMELQQDFVFIDVSGFRWCAPKGAIIDGASRPRLAWAFIGSPFVGEYRRASVVHDVYCQTKAQPHKLVHKMFYDAMRLDGVGFFKAKTMYFAVKLGGPKW
jgi:hypothetical protein